MQTEVLTEFRLRSCRRVSLRGAMRGCRVVRIWSAFGVVVVAEMIEMVGIMYCVARIHA